MRDEQNSGVPICEAQDGDDNKQSKQERARYLFTETGGERDSHGGERDRELVLRTDVKTNVQRC